MAIFSLLPMYLLWTVMTPFYRITTLLTLFDTILSYPYQGIIDMNRVIGHGINRMASDISFYASSGCVVAFLCTGHA